MVKHRRKLATAVPAKRPVGRPRTTGPGTMIAIRWQSPLIDGIEAYAKKQTLDRPNALRHIVTRYLIDHGYVDADEVFSRNEAA